jgi:eukaryotic-like serine/threonine-protein kinase
VSLQPGHRLGHYEILELIGKGGMGEVYRARDTKLGRDVAVKVLPNEFSRDSDRLERFEREARLLAQLNHSNIATLHGLEEHDGQKFLVMELVEGETLAERIARGPILDSEAFPLFIQIAEGLEAAHEKGTIHRDLKPANVKLGRSSRVKLLDFGLAKAFHVETTVEVSSQSPTLTREGTDARAVLGTVPYMSPEQAGGEAVDQRTDVWAFGCCLYEALTGRNPFVADSPTATVARILSGQPDWDALPAGAPAALRRLLRRCLAKNASDRFHHIADARLELRELTQEMSDARPRDAEAALGKKRAFWIAPWVLASGALVVAVMVHLRGPDPPERATERLTLRTDPLVLGDHPESSIVAISPDGSKVVYVGERQRGRHLFLRELGSYEASIVPGTENGHAPFFSPDGEWLGFVADGKLMKTSLGSGRALTLCEAADLHGASWGEDDRIAFGLGEHKGVSSVPAGGGAAEPLTNLDASRGREETWHVYPEFLPGGKALLFTTVDDGGGSPRIWAYSLETGQRRMLLPGGNARYVRTGHLVYPLAAALWAVRFDPERLELQGEPAIVVEGLMMGFSREPSIGHYDIAENGTLVYLGGELEGSRNILVSVSRDGEIDALTEAKRSYEGPRVSPDGRRIAVRMPDTRGQMQVWIYDRSRDAFSQLTTGGANWWPVWTPDGMRIVYPSISSGTTVDLHAVPADGSAPAEKLTTGGDSDQPYSTWGDWLFFQRSRKRFGVWILSLSGEGERSLLDSKANVFHPSISPDGRWLAYTSDEKAGELDTEVYVTAFPGPGPKWQISEGGGRAPVWSRDGDEIFFEGGTAAAAYEEGSVEMMAVDWITEPDVRPGKPKLFFRGDFLSSTEYGRNYDVLPDGRFVMLKPDRESPPPVELHVIRNWFGELNRLVPPKP